MDAFLRNAEQILETAVEASECGTSEYLISISYNGSIQMLSETEGWSLPALAAEHRAKAVYRVRRAGRAVRVEGWSSGRNCILNRDLAPKLSYLSGGVSLYAVRQPLLTGLLAA